jgi:hypothetical protein
MTSPGLDTASVIQKTICWKPVYPWRALGWLLEWTCELLGHPGGCWLMNNWRIGQWVVRHEYRAEFEDTPSYTR